MNSKQLAATHVFKASREACTNKLSVALNLRFLQKAHRSSALMPEYFSNSQLSCPGCYSIRLPGINSKCSLERQTDIDSNILRTRLIIDCLHCHYRSFTEIPSASSLCCSVPRESPALIAASSSSNSSAKKRAKIRKQLPSLRASNKVISKPVSSSPLGLETFFKPA